MFAGEKNEQGRSEKKKGKRKKITGKEKGDKTL